MGTAWFVTHPEVAHRPRGAGAGSGPFGRGPPPRRAAAAQPWVGGLAAVFSSAERKARETAAARPAACGCGRRWGRTTAAPPATCPGPSSRRPPTGSSPSPRPASAAGNARWTPRPASSPRSRPPWPRRRRATWRSSPIAASAPCCAATWPGWRSPGRRTSRAGGGGHLFGFEPRHRPPARLPGGGSRIRGVSRYAFLTPLRCRCHAAVTRAAHLFPARPV